MKSISWPSAAQLEELRTASEVCEETLPVKTDSETGEQTVDVALEAYAAAELILQTTKVQRVVA